MKYKAPRIALVLAVAAASEARAAGGHFDVDDAAVLDPGHCQYETWFARMPADALNAFHLGPACRVGPVEIGLNFDRLSAAEANRSYLGPQLKWVADPWIDKLGFGIAWSATFDLQRGGRPLHTVYVPFTWAANDQLTLNGNIGADWEPSGGRSRRVGVSGEWAANETLTLIAERVKFRGDWTSRLGLRLNVSEAISIDLSAARVGPGASRVYVIGLSHDFAR